MQRQLECQANDNKEVQENLEEKLKLLQDELEGLKDNSLKENHKWSEKIEKLQTALEQSEHLLAEKEKLLEVRVFCTFADCMRIGSQPPL